MLNFTVRKTFLIPSFDLDAKEREKLDRFLRVLERSKIEELFPVKEDFVSDKGGRPIIPTMICWPRSCMVSLSVRRP